MEVSADWSILFVCQPVMVVLVVLKSMDRNEVTFAEMLFRL